MLAGTAGAHAPHCHFHQLSDHMSGRSRYAAAVEEDVDGVRIHLNVALTVNLAEARRRTTPVAARQGGESQAAMTLLGLLHHLWERSALNRWPGRRGRRGWRECVHQLAEAIDETRLDQTALSQILYLVRPYSPDTPPRTTRRSSVSPAGWAAAASSPARLAARRNQG